MSDPFDNVNLLRVILEGETDADSPGSEELLSQLRENWEVSLILNFYTADSGTATENPAEETLTDDGAAYDVDEHNGRSLVIIDGNAAGNIYTIDDTTATTLVCTGDTLLTDGVLSGDAYKIFYNLKNTSAHKHDNVDSALVVLADGMVMLPMIMSESATAVSDGTNGRSAWADMDAGTAFFKWQIYVPVTAATIRMYIRAHRAGGNTDLDVRFQVGALTSGDTGVSIGDAYAWYELTLDVSSLSGWQELDIQELTGNDGGEDVEVQGFSFSWEN